MHKLLIGLLQKRGIQSPDELSIDEKIDFERWNSVLSEEKATLEGLVSFMQQLQQELYIQMENVDNAPEKTARLALMHGYIRRILEYIDSPAKEKDNLEKYLQSLLDTKDDEEV